MSELITSLCYRLALDPGNKLLARTLNKELIRSGLLVEHVRADKFVDYFRRKYEMSLEYECIGNYNYIFYNSGVYHIGSPILSMDTTDEIFKNINMISPNGKIKSLEFLTSLNTSKIQCLDFRGTYFYKKDRTYLINPIRLENLIEIMLPHSDIYTAYDYTTDKLKFLLTKSSMLFSLLSNLKKIKSKNEVRITISYVFNDLHRFCRVKNLDLKTTKEEIRNFSELVGVPVRFRSSECIFYLPASLE